MNGFSLIELLVALAIASVALLGIAGAELRALQESKFAYGQSLQAVNSYSMRNLQAHNLSPNIMQKITKELKEGD